MASIVAQCDDPKCKELFLINIGAGPSTPGVIEVAIEGHDVSSVCPECGHRATILPGTYALDYKDNGTNNLARLVEGPDETKQSVKQVEALIELAKKGEANQVTVVAAVEEVSPAMDTVTHKKSVKKAISAFKFLKYEHAQKLLTEGNIYIPLMQEFGDSTKYTGNIYDKEGFFTITNTYEDFTISENNVYGLLKEKFSNMPIGTFIKNDKKTARVQYESPFFIYCTSSLFFSDTFYFAVEEGKTSCVFITDIEKFTQVAAENIDFAQCVQLGYCNYVGRDIHEINPDAKSITESFLADTTSGFFIKPIEHAPQCELRSVWQRNKEATEGITAFIPALRELCIEVKFPELYDAVKAGKKLQELRISLIINYKDGRAEHMYSMAHVDSIWSPEVRYDENGKIFLFFKMPSVYPNAEDKVVIELTDAYLGGGLHFDDSDNNFSMALKHSESISISDIQSIEFSLAKALEAPQAAI